MGRSSLTSSTSSEDFSSLEWKRSNSQVLISNRTFASSFRVRRLPGLCLFAGANTIEETYKFAGKAPSVARVSISADGNSMTMTVKGLDAGTTTKFTASKQ
jgi:hypothetical protein